jgi:hypothetical protein
LETNMDPGAIYAVLIAAVLIACAAAILVRGIVRAPSGAWQAAQARSRADRYAIDYDPDVGRCIIAGCTNWCEDTICATHQAERAALARAFSQETGR